MSVAVKHKQFTASLSLINVGNVYAGATVLFVVADKSIVKALHHGCTKSV